MSAGVRQVSRERLNYVVSTGGHGVDVGMGSKGFDALEHGHRALAQLLLIRGAVPGQWVGEGRRGELLEDDG
jgi:hypothetical protein